MVAIARSSNDETVVGQSNMQKGGWFSSLRRQPKGSAGKGKSGSGLQKSCVDLSSSVDRSNDDLFISGNGNGQITCSECHRYFSPAVVATGLEVGGVYQGKNLDEVVRNAINSSKIGAKYSQTGTTTVNKTVSVDRTEEAVRKEDTAEFTERITVTRTTVIKKPVKRIEFFQLNNNKDGDAVSTKSEGTIVTGNGTQGGGGVVPGKTVTFSSNRNGLVFDDDGKVLGNSLNFDFEFIDEDRLSSKSPTPPGTTQISSASSTPTTPVKDKAGELAEAARNGEQESKALIKLNALVQQRLGVNTCKLGGSGGVGSSTSTINICDNCLNKRFKSRSDWNISSSKVFKE